MRIRDLRPRPVITIAGFDSLRVAAKQLAEEEIGALAVFDAQGPRGVFSERDLVRAVAHGVDLDDTPVSDYMTESPVTIAASSAVAGAVAKMNEFGLRHLIVVDDDGDVVGMISMRDIVMLLGTSWVEL